MRHEDPRANNLIARLFAYAPREGRQPLEDYCSEILAWCLRAYPALLAKMFEGTNLQSVIRKLVTFAVHTQLPFKLSDEHRDEGNSASERFDVVIEGGLENRVVIVIESQNCQRICSETARNVSVETE
jgi:hypothetical protein